MDVIDIALSKSYTDVSMEGGGAVQGKNCTISSITDITGGHRITFSWTLDDGTAETATMDVMDGTNGIGITSITIDNNNHLIITDTDGNDIDAGAIYEGTTAADVGALALTGGSLSGSLTVAREHSGTTNIDTRIDIGNSTPVGTTGCTRGYVRMFAKNGKYTNLVPNEASDSLTYMLPKDKENNSVLAVTSDIPTSSSDLSDGPFLSKASGGEVNGNVTVDKENGTTTSIGESIVAIGNNIAKGTAKNTKGTLRIYGTGTSRVSITTSEDDITSDRTLKLPNKNGTIAVTADIPSIPTLSFTRKDFTFNYTSGEDTTVTITNSGWTPIAITNVFFNAQSISCNKWQIKSSTQAVVSAINLAGAAVGGQGKLQVLYYKYQ